MLGRILAEARGAPRELVETLQLEEIDATPRPCLTLRHPPAELGLGRRPAPGRARVRLRRRPLIPAGRTTPLAVSTELGLVIRRDPRDRGAGRHPPVRAGLPRGEGPPGRARDDGAARQADGAGDPGPGPARLAGRGRGEADPPGRRVQARRDHRHRLVRARRPGRLRRPERHPARPPRRRPPGRDHGRPGRRLDGDAPRGLAQEVRHARRPGDRRGRPPPVRQRPRPACSTPLLAAQPEIQVDAAFDEGPRAAPPVRGGRAAGRPGRASTASSGPTSARAWAGSTTSRSSTSAASWPTTWAWARRSRCWPCSSAGAPAGRPRGRRWPSSPARSSSTGSRRPRSSPRGCRVLDYTGPGPPRPPRRRSRNYDLIVTTYGTLRTDIVELSEIDVRLRDPRRGPGDQERRQPGRQGRPAAPKAGTGWP